MLAVLYDQNNRFKIIMNGYQALKNNEIRKIHLGQTGRQLKCRMKIHEVESKLDFQKKSGKDKKDMIFGFMKHIEKKRINYFGN